MERGAKNLPCKAMRSHVNQRTLAQRMQQSSSDGASLAEAAQLARRDGVADRPAEAAAEAAAAASRVHGMSKSNTRHSSIKSQPEGCLFALSPPSLFTLVTLLASTLC